MCRGAAKCKDGFCFVRFLCKLWDFRDQPFSLPGKTHQIDFDITYSARNCREMALVQCKIVRMQNDCGIRKLCRMMGFENYQAFGKV